VADELEFDYLVKGDRDVVDANERIAKSSSDAALKIEASNIRLIKARQALTNAEAKYGKESIQARSATLALAQAQSKLEKSLHSTGEAAEKTESKFSGFGDRLESASAAAGLAAGAALGAAFVGALDIESANAKLTAQLGLSAKESEKYGAIAGDLYANAYGDSIQTVNQALKEVSQQRLIDADANSADIEAVTGKVLALSDAFEQDLAGTARAAGQLIRTGLAKDADEALDLITVGLQKIPGAGDDLLDTLNEYGTQFRSLGLTGPQALNFIAAAMEGGARDTDIAADALKEFSLRARDLSDDNAQEALTELGFAAQDMARKLAGGGNSAAQATIDILSRLRAVPDPAKRSQLAIALLGTQAEDLQDALFAVDPQKLTQGLGDIEGAAARVDEQLGKTSAATLTSFKRNVEQNFTDAAAAVIDFGAANSGIVGPLTAVVGATAGAVVGINTAVKVVGASRRAYETASTAIESFTGSTGRANRALVAVGKAGAVVGTLLAVGQAIKAIAPDVDDAAIGIGKMSLALRQFSDEKATANIGTLGKDFDDLGMRLNSLSDPGLMRRWEDFTSFAFSWASGSTKGGDARRAILNDLSSLDAALAQLVNSGDTDRAAQLFQKLNDEAVAGGAGVDQLARHLPTYTDAVAAAGAESGGAVTPVKDLAKGLGAQGSAAALAAEDLTKLAESTETYTNNALSARGSARAFEQAIDDANEAVKTNGKTLDITTEKGRANAAALDEIASSGVEYANQIIANGGSEKQFQEQLQRTRDRLIAAASKMEGGEKAAKRLADQILQVPSSRNINFSTNAGPTKDRVVTLKRSIDRITGKTVTVTVRYRASGDVQLRQDLGDGRSRTVTARALGGPVKANQPYIVGERRPELFVPKTDGYIVPEVPKSPRVAFATPTSDAMGGRMVLEIRSGGSRLDDALVEILRRSVRTAAGGNVQVALGRIR
jgi:phage-related minor tail protein